MHPLDTLQAWYLKHCDGDWEHTFGICVETLDNPGWALKIDIAETRLEDVPFTEVSEDGDTSWLFARVEDRVFHVACGPTDLTRAVSLFLDWSATHGRGSAP